MQPADGKPVGNPYRRGAYDPRGAAAVDPRRVQSRRPWTSCLVWGMVLMLGLGLAALLVIGAGYAGWSSGVELARESGTSTAVADVQVQCARLAAEIVSGNQQLILTRIEFLRAQTPEPACLSAILPTATAIQQQLQPTTLPEATVTATPVPTQVVVLATVAPPASTAVPEIAYDLDALLSEAQLDIGVQNYRDAIDTLDAIIAIDGDFQSERVNEMYFAALTAQARALYRTGRLSEAIVVTGRAETHGDIGELNYERSIARLYLDGLRLKSVNPGESVRLFSSIVHTFGHGDYMNGEVLAQLQEAHHNYGDAYAFQGEHCLAYDQYAAALALRPVGGNIAPGVIRTKQDRAAAACPARTAAQSPPQTTSASSPPVSTRAAPNPIGERATPAPVGQSG